MNALSPIRYATPDDPAELGWPPAFPIEVALRVAPIKQICEAHGITKEHYNVLRTDPGFLNVLAGYAKMLKEHGASFKLKAMIQSEELLKTSWAIIHAVDTPAAVKADLIKHTIRFAGLDASLDQKGGGANNQANFQINLNLG
jgi:hypothetical protein